MEKLENLLQTVSKFNVNIDTDTLGYYRYKVSLIDAIFSFLGYIAIGVIVGFFIYLVSLSCKEVLKND